MPDTSFRDRVRAGPATSIRRTSAAPGGFDLGDVDFLHGHHGIEGALGFIAAGRHRLGQHARGDLPGDAPFVLAPAAGTFLAAIAAIAFQ